MSQNTRIIYRCNRVFSALMNLPNLQRTSALMNQLLFSDGIMAPPEGQGLFSVRLIDCRTGEVPSLNGFPFSVLTRAPRAVSQSFLRGRNKRLWRTEVEPVATR